MSPGFEPMRRMRCIRRSARSIERCDSRVKLLDLLFGGVIAPDSVDGQIVRYESVLDFRQEALVPWDVVPVRPEPDAVVSHEFHEPFLCETPTGTLGGSTLRQMAMSLCRN